MPGTHAANQERPLGRLAGFACSTLLDPYLPIAFFNLFTSLCSKYLYGL